MAKSNVLNTLRAAEASALRAVEKGQRELNGIRAAIAAVAGSLANSLRGRARAPRAAGTRKRRRSNMSAAARKAVSLRMKKYWAARRAGAKK